MNRELKPTWNQNWSFVALYIW